MALVFLTQADHKKRRRTHFIIIMKSSVTGISASAETLLHFIVLFLVEEHVSSYCEMLSFTISDYDIIGSKWDILDQLRYM